MSPCQSLVACGICCPLRRLVRAFYSVIAQRCTEVFIKIRNTYALLQFGLILDALEIDIIVYLVGLFKKNGIGVRYRIIDGNAVIRQFLKNGKISQPCGAVENPITPRSVVLIYIDLV